MTHSGRSGYRRLAAPAVMFTAHRLKRRIEARFGDRGLTRVAAEVARSVAQVADATEASRARVRRATWYARAAGAVVILIGLVALAAALRDAIGNGPDNSFDWLPLVESTIQNIVFGGLAVLFVWALPQRLERQRLLSELYRLRSLAHVIDMHQLTKDPERAHPTYTPTDESVDIELTADELHHYLAYCSELLSLVAKTAALCAEDTSDSVVLDTISTLERLTVDLSNKIWQKISLLPV
ncbi:hypothetical protein [Nocardioides speluncae]|uniref:hypothetical protein n=1 Tax=Nocardioides speluncae TaxID=2670337 RepID=UPI001F0BE66B|nr:hypothetical protein [Nocardioides speluncae]